MIVLRKHLRLCQSLPLLRSECRYELVIVGTIAPTGIVGHENDHILQNASIHFISIDFSNGVWQQGLR